MDEQQRLPGDASLEALHAFAARVRNAQHDTTELDAAAAEALQALDRAGVEALLLKGRALGVLLYDDLGGGRGYSDVDLLVAPDDLDAAEQVVAGLRYANVGAVQGVDDRSGAVQAHTWARRGDAMESEMIDLHWALPGARVTPETQWRALCARTTGVEVGGHLARALNVEGQALQLAMHAAQHGPAIEKNLAELSLALARWPISSWQAASALAEEIAATEAFAAGLRLVPRGAAVATELALPSTAELDWRIRNRADAPRGTFYLDALSSPQSSSAWLRLVRLTLLPGRDWVLYQYPWARASRLLLPAAYGAHLLRVPLWSLRAWRYIRRGRRAGRNGAVSS